MTANNRLSLLAAGWLALAMAPAAFAAEAADDMPARITIEAPGSLPEGIEYDAAAGHFLVGSLSAGTVYAIGRDGTRQPVVEDPDLESSVGIEVDAARKRLIVTNSDRAVFQGESPGQAKLGIYDLATGERHAMIDLAAAGPDNAEAHFANDVAVGEDGTLFVTDSFARVIYRVGPDHAASVLLPNRFAEREQFMLNGIVHHPDGYLLVAESRGGGLYKVSLEEPGAFSAVALPQSLDGADGMVWHPDGSLLVVRNDASQRVVALRSDDDWASAAIVKTGALDGQGTTAAIAEGEVYVVHPQFGDAEANPFIERVELEHYP